MDLRFWKTDGQSKRMGWIDIAKGIGIIFVVLAHTQRGESIKLVRDWIYTFHMPLFLFISGYLFAYKKHRPTTFGVFLPKLALSLLVPFAFFKATDYVWWLGIENRFRAFDLGPSWFLLMIFVLQVIFIVLLQGTKWREPVMMVVLALIFALFLHLNRVAIDGQFSEVIELLIASMFWFLSGIMINEFFNDPLKGREAGVSTYILVLLLVPTTFYLSRFAPGIDMYNASFANPLLFILFGFMGITMIILCALAIKSNAVLEYLGRNTLIILCTHEPIKRIFIKMLSLGTGASVDQIRNSLIGGLAVTLAVLIANIVLIEVIRYLYSKVKHPGVKKVFAFMK